MDESEKKEKRRLRKERRERNKWMCRLPGELINKVLECDPREVIFTRSGNYTVAKIITDNYIGVGTSICSTTEWEFDEMKGRMIALGRAVKALINEKDSKFVRNDFEEFPGNWTKNQIENVWDSPNKAKSVFLRRLQ